MFTSVENTYSTSHYGYGVYQCDWRTYVSAPLSATASVLLLLPSVDLLTIGDEIDIQN